MRGLLALPLLACGADADRPRPSHPTTDSTPAPAVPPNLLLVVADDLGADQLAAYGVPDPARTPVLDAFAADSVRFRTAYSSPNCSPTRAELLTGQYNHRSRVTSALDWYGAVALPEEAWTLPEALREVGYTSAFVGKWHLGNATVGWDHPRQSGFDVFRGSMGNLDDGLPPPEGEAGYRNWYRVVDGAGAWTDVYATTSSVDDASDLIAALPEPWLIVVSFNAAHSPWHAPPDALYGGGLPPGASVPELYRAAVTALDTELGRLLGAVDPEDTVVVFTGDNGTPTEIVGWPAKGSAYEPGIRVPLFLRGPGFAAREVEEMVGLVDVMPTLLELAGAPMPAPLDGVPLATVLADPAVLPGRDLLYAGRSNLGDPMTGLSRMVRDPRFKLHHEVSGAYGERFALFDLVADPGELTNLLDAPLAADAAAAHEALLTAYEVVLQPL